MTIGERLLLFISRSPESSDYNDSKNEWTTKDALSLLIREYPNIGNLISGKKVIDFGCGAGYQSVALVSQYDCYVVGIDTNRNTLQKAIDLARAQRILETRLSFKDRITDDMKGTFDIVISQNSFEHFDAPITIVNEMRSLINKSGTLLITFGPPWFSPYGSHMHFFCKCPWLNILFAEQTVMRVRGRFRNDGGTRYEDVESGLNKMSVSRFEKIISSCGLDIKYRKYSCVKGINVFAKVPILRELFINHVSVSLTHRLCS